MASFDMMAHPSLIRKFKLSVLLLLVLLIVGLAFAGIRFAGWETEKRVSQIAASWKTEPVTLGPKLYYFDTSMLTTPEDWPICFRDRLKRFLKERPDAVLVSITPEYAPMNRTLGYFIVIR